MKHVAAIVVLVAAAAASGQTPLKTADDARKASESFLQKMLGWNIDEAFAVMEEHSSMGEQMTRQKAAFKSAQDTLKRDLGRGLSNELILEKTFRDALVMQVYMSKYERAPLRWVFIYYRTADGWVLNRLKFSGLSEEFFEDK